MDAAINRSLSYQHHIPFFEDHLTCIIYALHDVNKIGSGLRSAANGSIPTFTYFTGAENKLAPAIVHSEIIQFLYPYTNRAKNIIAPITIRSKSTGNKNIRARFKELYCDRILAITTKRVCCTDNVSDRTTHLASVECCNRIWN